MNRVVFYFVIVCLLAAVIQCHLSEEDNKTEYLRTMITESLEDCYEDDERTIKVEWSEEGFDALLKSSPTPPHNTKCMRYCVMLAHKLYNEDDTIDIKQLQALFLTVYPDVMTEENLKVVATVSEECSGKIVKEDDRCESAHESAMCILAGLGERGIVIREI